MSDPNIVLQNLRMRRGDTPTFLLTVTDRAGAIFPITGFGIWLTAKNTIDDPDPGVFQVSTVSGDISISNGAGGLAEITIPAAATVGFTTDRNLVYDVQIRNVAQTRTYTVAGGTLQVVRDVTRA